MTLVTRLATVMTLAAAAAAVVSGPGCAPERHAAVPADARMLAEGDGQITATATERGMVYISDRNDNRLLYSGDVNQGDVVTVNPETNQVTISGRVVQDKTLHRGHNHRIFFDPDMP